MASPVDSARQGTNITTAATSHAINVGSPVAGTLLIVFVRCAAAPGLVTFTGYTGLVVNELTDASDDESFIYYRWADGTEGATDTLTTTNSVKLAAICWEVTGAADPSSIPPSLSDLVVGTAANINPPIAGKVIERVNSVAASSGTVRGETGSSERLAQSFVALGTTITNVSLRLQKTASPTDNLIVEIQGDSAEEPSGASLGTVATIAGTSLTTSLVLTDMACSISVTEGTTYWIVVRRSGANDNVNFYNVGSGSAAYLYEGGVRKSRSTGVWGSPSTNDHHFKVNFTGGASVDYLFLTLIGMDHETATATQPAGYSNLANANSGTGGAVATNCMIWGASKAATGVTSDDPAAWTSSAPATGVTAWTIAIPPAAAAAPGPVLRKRRASRFLTIR